MALEWKGSGSPTPWMSYHINSVESLGYRGSPASISEGGQWRPLFASMQLYRVEIF